MKSEEFRTVIMEGLNRIPVVFRLPTEEVSKSGLPITRKKGSELIKDYWKTKREIIKKGLENETVSVALSQEAIFLILSQPKCEGLRFYYCKNEKNQFSFVVVGIDSSKKDLTSKNHKFLFKDEEGDTEEEKTIIFEAGNIKYYKDILEGKENYEKPDLESERNITLVDSVNGTINYQIPSVPSSSFGKPIRKSVAKRRVKDYWKTISDPKETIAVTFKQEVLLLLLSQFQCEGVRFYFCKVEDGNEEDTSLVLVGIKGNGENMDNLSFDPVIQDSEGEISECNVSTLLPNYMIKELRNSPLYENTYLFEVGGHDNFEDS